MNALRNLRKKRKPSTAKPLTIDPRFEDARQKWIQTSGTFQTLSESIAKQDGVKDLDTPSLKVAQILSECFDDDPELAQFKTQLNNVHEKVQSATKTYLQTQKVLSDHLNSLEFISSAKSVKKSIKERDNYVSDYDKSKYAVESLRKKLNEESPDLFLAEQKYEISKSVYERENEELTKKLTELYEKRYFDFESVFKKLCGSQVQLFNSMQESYKLLQPLLDHPVKENDSEDENASTNSNTTTPSPAQNQIDENFIILNVPFQPPPVKAAELDYVYNIIYDCFPDNLKNDASLHQLVKILLEPKFRFVECITKTTSSSEGDKVAQSLITLFNAANWSIYLLKFVISHEIAYLSKLDQPFQSLKPNGMASKMMYCYAKPVLDDFIVKVFKPCFLKLKDFNKPVELDLSKLPDGQNVEDNALNLLSITQVFFEALISSVDECPWPIRELCFHLKEEVSKKFATEIDLSYKVIGGFFFTKMINPVLLAPDSNIKLLSSQDFTPEMRKAVPLISRVLQNLITFTNSNFKDEFMKPTANWITERFQAIRDFEDKLAINIPISLQNGVSDTEKWSALTTLYSSISKEKTKISAALSLKQETELMELFVNIMSEIPAQHLVISPNQ